MNILNAPAPASASKPALEPASKPALEPALEPGFIQIGSRVLAIHNKVTGLKPRESYKTYESCEPCEPYEPYEPEEPYASYASYASPRFPRFPRSYVSSRSSRSSRSYVSEEYCGAYESCALDFVLNIAKVNAFLSQRWAKIDKGLLTAQAIPFRSNAQNYKHEAPASDIHTYYLDSKRFPELYTDKPGRERFEGPAQVAALASHLHPRTALLILEDETQNITTGGKPCLSQDAIVTLIRKAAKAPNGHIAIHEALTSGVLHQPEAILELIRQKPDIKLPDSIVSLISFPDGKTIRNIDFSKLENAKLIDTKNIVFEFCTFGPNMSKEQLATAADLRDCTYEQEIEPTGKKSVGERIASDTKTPHTKFPTVGKPTPPTPPQQPPNLCPSGTNGANSEVQHIPNKGSGGFAK